MSEILDPIDEMSPSPEEENSRLEQLMINMLEVRREGGKKGEGGRKEGRGRDEGEGEGGRGGRVNEQVCV